MLSASSRAWVGDGAAGGSGGLGKVMGLLVGLFVAAEGSDSVGSDHQAEHTCWAFLIGHIKNVCGVAHREKGHRE